MKQFLNFPAAVVAILSLSSVAVAQSPTPKPVDAVPSTMTEPIEAAAAEESSDMDFSMAGPECANGYYTLGNGVIILCGERSDMGETATEEAMTTAEPMADIPMESDTEEAPSDELADGPQPQM